MRKAAKRFIFLLALLLANGCVRGTKIGGGWNQINHQHGRLQPWAPPHLSRTPPPLMGVHDEGRSLASTKRRIDQILSVSGGQEEHAGGLEKTANVVGGIVASCVRTALPPTVACARAVIAFYRALPKDAILAQAGLVYCFAGGYYPTLFAGLQAARQCGWEAACQAVDDLAQEATKAIEASTEEKPSGRKSDDAPLSAKDILIQKTLVVFATVDPTKINQAAGALYTTWMGVSAVLEKEFARTITLSLTIQGYLQPTAEFILAPPARMCIPEEYHKWVPVLIEWGCKAAAMSVAWRIQRIMSATASAVAGGLMFSRAVFRMLSKRGWRLFGLIKEDHEATTADEILGVLVAGIGIYSQLRSGFSFEVPFPLSLVTWPFDWAEKWIQWQITKEAT